MAIATYNDLQSTVLEWIERDDLAAAVPTFIQLAETSFNRLLRTRQQQTSATLTLDSEVSAALPDDFEELISLVLPENPNRALKYASPLEFQRVKYDNPSSGAALVYTIRGNDIVLAPGAGTIASVDILYYATIPSLAAVEPPTSDDDAPGVPGTQTNWLLSKWPDVYLYATCLQAGPYLRDAEMLQVWSAGLEKTLKEIEDADRGAKYNGSPLVMRARGFRG